MRRKVKQGEQGKRQQNLIERVIWWIATRPWVMSRTGYTKAYHLGVEVADLDAILRWFNDAAEVIDQHYSNFGMRLSWGFVRRGDEEVKAIHLTGQSGVGWALIDWLAFTNKTLTRKSPLPMSDEDRALRIAARDRLNQLVPKIGHGIGQRPPGSSVPFLIPGDKRYNYRPDAPPEPALESYGPEDWKLMSNFLLLIAIPEKDFEYQAKAYDGWWNRRGRKKVALQNIRSRIAPFQ